MNFIAIDFETSNYDSNSACAVGLAVVRNGEVVNKHVFFFCPPDSNFVFTYLHGISYDDVKNEPTFAEVWPRIQKIIGNLPFVAHNASFDMKVLQETLNYYGIPYPKIPCACTCMISRRVWPQLSSHSLDTVANYLNLPLDHHNPVSDAEVCAQIAIEASLEGGFHSLLDMTNALGIRYDYLTKRKSSLKKQKKTIGNISSFKNNSEPKSFPEEIKAMRYNENITSTKSIADKLALKLTALREKYGIRKK
ncbi:MAG: 3'-5' exonuclease [Candidatus Hydrogenedentes bacterium]|nr:3'-5' exonuclease [Candidatus Hydrogenedentota bacterium]